MSARFEKMIAKCMTLAFFEPCQTPNDRQRPQATVHRPQPNTPSKAKPSSTISIFLLKRNKNTLFLYVAYLKSLPLSVTWAKRLDGQVEQLVCDLTRKRQTKTAQKNESDWPTLNAVAVPSLDSRLPPSNHPLSLPLSPYKHPPHRGYIAQKNPKSADRLKCYAIFFKLVICTNQWKITVTSYRRVADHRYPF